MKKFFIFVLFVFLLNTCNNKVQANRYCITPPFITQSVKPNVIVILDNSNSMDEDFYGNAAGSYSPDSKSVVARKALRNLIDAYKNKLRIGLITYQLPNDVSEYHIHNSPYFVSYEPKSYCPNPPPECVEYCQTGNSTAKDICESECQNQNPDFDVNYIPDEIITHYSIGSEQRNRYCRLIYPKTQRYENPTDSGHYIYYKQALPYYSPDNEGTSFCYSPNYNPEEGEPYDEYKCYEKKTGTSDDFSGYQDFEGTHQFIPTDTDFALGYYDFGRRLVHWHVGRTWFSNESPGNGYIQVEANDLTTDSGGNSTTFNTLWEKLDPKENDEDGYMSCDNYNKNNCPYIINAGLTPTAGTFQTAIDYLEGDETPIQYWCQKTFIIYVTDGLPSVDENGDTATADQLMPDVLQKLQTLRNLSVSINGTTYTVDVKTYVLGVGLTDEAKKQLDKMAVAGGTDKEGHAYYANNPDELYENLRNIFLEILKNVSSGTSISVISEKTRKGANLIQAVFYPEKSFENGTGTVKVSWVGFLNNFWLMRGDTPEAVTLREDTDEDKALSFSEDWIMEFANINNQLTINLYHDYDKDGICDNQDSNGTCIPDAQKNLDETKKIWEAGEILHQTSPNERKIWVNLDLNGDGAVNLEDAFKESSYTQLKTYLEETDDTKAQEIISYIRGEEIYGARSRLVNGKVWKLSDIIYSTPQVVDYDDYSVVYVGANDGMLHAFRLGKLTSTGLTGDHITKLCDSSAATCTTTEVGKEIWSFIPRNSLPYLKYLMDNDYCHLYYVDLTPFVFEATVGTETRTILIGGMRLGGACGCTGTNCIQPPAIYCKDSSNNIVDCSQAGAIPYCVFEDGSVKKCDGDGDGIYDNGVVGLSSYFALDITDPENPKLLWEFSNPYLGFSYSGPAVMKIGSTYYVAFGSGPTNYAGESDYPLRIFVLKLNPDLTIGNVYTISQIETSTQTTPITLNNAFSGRLFVYKEGVSYNNPVFLGYTQKGSWKGGVLKLYPVVDNNNEISEWKAKIVMNKVDGQDMGPITAKVVEAEVAGEKWLIFGEGRYFTGANDDPDAIRRIYGVKADIEENADIEDVTDNVSGISSGNGWFIRLEGASGGYNAERMITDPIAVDTGYENIAFFITFQPTADVCGFGGRTFVWTVTTTGGGAISNPGFGGKLFVQVSTGQIATFTKAEGRKSGPIQGVPSETAPAFVRHFSAIGYKGKILHIIER